MQLTAGKYTMHVQQMTYTKKGRGTSSSAMAERPRELGDFKKARVNGGTNKCGSVNGSGDTCANP